MIKQLLSKEKKLAVVGLGYVGLPIALEFAKKISVIGFDINQKRIEMMCNCQDPSYELSAEDFAGADITFTADIEVLRQANFFIIAVPTPIDEYNQPNLFPLTSASKTVGKALKAGDYVVYESTVYPGCTEEDCIPVLEKESGLKFITDFKVGYSPERINPGDKVHTLTNTVKIVSGCDEESLDQIAKVYELIIQAGVHRAPNIKVAEAGKIIENTQRDVNIALMNELSIIFNRIGINTFDVIEAAGTKWNFLKFYPGLVGGHCIGVDPYYLVHKAKQKGYHAQLIDAGRFINDSMGGYIAKQTVKKILAADKHLLQSRVLVMGFTFKENVADIRNSKVFNIIKELQSYRVQVDVVDPYADAEELKSEYHIELNDKPQGKYDAIIAAVAHKQYRAYTEKDFLELSAEKGILIDVKGLYKNNITKLTYWSL
ncbi:MAG: nucleotide sugar dehydrogenase [Prevotellaceae bacterium]|jgi:UDP-N-acetyl-D-galactosamine dehydrogenase|nr:nucleotide sugar dehydrogenase [Prevotellaceae bacterium]